MSNRLAIVEWFNKDAPVDRKRRWLASEMLPDPPAPKETPKRTRYVYDDVFLSRRSSTMSYVRAWRGEGRGPNAELVVQVWLGRSRPEGEPDGDWVMPLVLGVPACIRQAVLQTTPQESKT